MRPRAIETAIRVSATATVGTGAVTVRAASCTTATAPRATASAMNACPSARSPRSATKSVPGPDGTRVGGDRVDGRRERAGDACARERSNEPGGVTHQCSRFGVSCRGTKRGEPLTAGMISACIIASRASAVKTGAAT